MLEYTLRALKSVRRLRNIPLGVLYYADEGQDAQYSDDIIRSACERADRILVLRPGNAGDMMVNQRRGQRKYRLSVEGVPTRLGASSRRPEVLRWLFGRLEALSKLSLRTERVAVAATELHTDAFPLQLPHRARVTILTSYPDARRGDRLETQMNEVLDNKGPRWQLTRVADRPPMADRRINTRLVNDLTKVAEQWEIPVVTESSLWPSVAGLVPSSKPVLCGIGPVAHDLYTSRETVSRISLVQRTLLLSQYLLQQSPK